MEKVSIAILSAGKGTRMKSSTSKVLHKIGGEPLIHIIIKEAQKISDDITIVVANYAQQVIDSVRPRFPNVKFLFQDDDNYPGTGGSLRDYNPKYRRVLVLNGDMPLIKAEKLREFLSTSSLIAISVVETENPQGYGRVILENNEVVKIVEEKDASEEEKKIRYINGGVYLFDIEILKRYLPQLSNQNAQREYYITDVIHLAKRDGHRIQAIFLPAENLLGVNSRVDLAKAEEIYLRRIRNRIMREGTTIHLPESVYIENSVQFIGECEIEPNVVITGKSVIVNSKIRAGSVVEDSYIGNSTIGVMAHIRPGSYILNSKIGNFVEVKNSNLEGVKAGHLAYLGDASIGEGTNIGAGVITANYDGKKKYRTKIGKNVFVGSDSQIIAPVEIGDNIMIGAGTTIPSNAEIQPGSLAISRTNLRVIKDFFFKFFNKENR